MSKREQGQDKTGTEAKTEIINKIIEKVEEIIKDSREGPDSTGDTADTIKEIFQPILDEFKDLIEENEDKKSFIGGLIKIFTILLSSKDNNLIKIKKNNKGKHENSFGSMARTRVTVRRLKVYSKV